MLIGFLHRPVGGKNAFCSLQSQGNECRRGPEVPPDTSAACCSALEGRSQAGLLGGPELPGQELAFAAKWLLENPPSGRKGIAAPTGGFALCILK